MELLLAHKETISFRVFFKKLGPIKSELFLLSTLLAIPVIMESLWLARKIIIISK